MMRRRLVRGWRGIVAALMIGAGAAAPAQEFGGLARLDVAQSQVRDEGAGIALDLWLSQPVPWRVFTLDAPPRLVVDFREVDWRGASRAGLLNSDRASDLSFGALRPGWSRLVLDLAGPYGIGMAEMRVNPVDGTARVAVRLDPMTEAAFAAAAGAPGEAAWDLAATGPAPAPPPPGDLVVAIDAGHGGIDPGAMREGLIEAELMLQLARELAEAVARTPGMTPVLTRDADIFVPLAERMTIARAAGADVFLSLHADALEMDAAVGGSVYTLSAEALDQASQRMAERHNRGDLLAGLDLSGQDDTVATVLMDLARIETGPRSLRLADALVQGLADAGAVLNARPRREAPLAVLNAADFPSVLVEAGFLSSAEDRARLTSPQGRAAIVEGIMAGLLRWQLDEAARAPLIRQ